MLYSPMLLSLLLYSLHGKISEGCATLIDVEYGDNATFTTILTKTKFVLRNKSTDQQLVEAVGVEGQKNCSTDGKFCLEFSKGEAKAIVHRATFQDAVPVIYQLHGNNEHGMNHFCIRVKGCSKEISQECGGDVTHPVGIKYPIDRAVLRSNASLEPLLEVKGVTGEMMKCSDDEKFCLNFSREGRVTVIVRNATYLDDSGYYLRLHTGDERRSESFCMRITGVCKPSLTWNHKTMTCTVEARLKSENEELKLTWLDEHRKMYPLHYKITDTKVEGVVTSQSSLTLNDDIIKATSVICCSAAYKGSSQAKESCENIPTVDFITNGEESSFSPAKIGVAVGALLLVVSITVALVWHYFRRKRKIRRRTRERTLSETPLTGHEELDPRDELDQLRHRDPAGPSGSEQKDSGGGAHCLNADGGEDIV